VKGLGEDDPFSRRQRAAEAFIPPPEPPDDDETPPDQEKPVASNSASNTATVGAGSREEEKPVPTVATETDANLPPPPPAREPVGRVQFNQRILSDRRRVLDKYRRQHGATWQGLFDQMVDEYLSARGLLPQDRGEQ